MAIVRPFKGLRYNPEKIQGSLADVIAPPYDVISLAEQDALYRRSSHNVVRLILNREYDGDGPGDNRYTRAACKLNEWVKDNVLRQDEMPAFYVYEQTFDIAAGGAARSKILTRRGVLTALKLEPFGEGCVYPHEETFSGPKADRLMLTRACRANLSPVFGLTPDADGSLAGLLADCCVQFKPQMEVKEDSGVLNRLWVVDDPVWTKKMTDAFTPCGVYIADGHHRYETACNYRNERRAQKNGNGGGVEGDRDYDYVLMMCVPMSDPGLHILPTHRLIHALPDFSAEKFLKKALALFDVTEATEDSLTALAEQEEGAIRIGVVFNQGGLRILKIKPDGMEAMRNLAPKCSEAWRELDVSVLHELLLKGVLGLSEENVLRKEGVTYVKDARETILRVQAEPAFSLGFILRPTRIEQVRVVAAGGERMPHKSTYFFPKLLSGMVIRKA
jgi:uncharacterized protein (DUF1015 family)